MRGRARFLVVAMALLMLPTMMYAQGKRQWRAMTPAELEAALPARATVEKERIETEMRTATGVEDAQGKVVAAVVLITAGYAANGKYSYYMVVQAPMRIGPDILLQPGNYVVGWTRGDDGLLVHFYEAETGNERGTMLAKPLSQPLMVVSVKLWPPADRSIIQIGRFALPYTLE
ncbi:MAG: hypothetical protein HIU91_03715 [Acidobacteria bacterium]|nr:hypothetical protein [Acidobacteriota bacterium]